MKYTCLLFDEDRQSKLVEKKLEDFELDSGEVLIRAEYSGINFKDALGVLDRGQIFKVHPIVPGVDVAGVISHSRSRKFREGDAVLVNGMGLGEDRDGGYSEYVKVPETMVVPRPKQLSAKEAMILGTAGFTAALAVERMLVNGQTFDKGPILVSGATGGVGSFAIQILSHLGFFVEATTTRPERLGAYLESLGAHYVSDLQEILLPDPRPLEKSQWGGVIDNLGGSFLQSVVPAVGLWGNVACVGLAQEAQWQATVMPFILRGVSLLGASSNNCSKELRDELWERLSTEWRPTFLQELVTAEVGLDGIVAACQKILDHKNHGRILIKI